MKPYKSLFTESAKTDYTKFFNLFKRTQDLYIGSQVKSMGGEIVSEVEAFNVKDIVTVKTYLDSVGIKYRTNKINSKIISIVWSRKSNMDSNIVQPLEVKQIVDISNLEWKNIGQSFPKEAESSCRPGWRLPTIQELYTASMKINNFNILPQTYCSSSTNPSGLIWVYDFNMDSSFLASDSTPVMVACVKG